MKRIPLLLTIFFVAVALLIAVRLPNRMKVKPAPTQRVEPVSSIFPVYFLTCYSDKVIDVTPLWVEDAPKDGGPPRHPDSYGCRINRFSTIRSGIWQTFDATEQYGVLPNNLGFCDPPKSSKKEVKP